MFLGGTNGAISHTIWGHIDRGEIEPAPDPEPIAAGRPVSEHGQG